MAKKDYEVIKEKWMHTGTLDYLGYALARDVEASVEGYDWIKTEPERRLMVIRNLFRAAASLHQAAVSKLEEYEREAMHRGFLATPEPTAETTDVPAQEAPSPSVEPATPKGVTLESYESRPT